MDAGLAPDAVTITPRAAARIRKILSKEGEASMLRVAVNGGGCSGFSYAFDIEQAGSDDDLVLDAEGRKVLIDAVSLEYLKGSRIDFVDDLIGQSFKIENPNATASCGCGTSFAV